MKNRVHGNGQKRRPKEAHGGTSEAEDPAGWPTDGKETQGDPVAIVIKLPDRPSGKTIVRGQIDAMLKAKQQSEARWKWIEDLLAVEGYTLERGLFEHEIKKRSQKKL